MSRYGKKMVDDMEDGVSAAANLIGDTAQAAIGATGSGWHVGKKNTCSAIFGILYLLYFVLYVSLGSSNPAAGGYDPNSGASYMLKNRYTSQWSTSDKSFNLTSTTVPATDRENNVPVYVWRNVAALTVVMGLVYILISFLPSIVAKFAKGTDKQREQTVERQRAQIVENVGLGLVAAIQAFAWVTIHSDLTFYFGEPSNLARLYLVGTILGYVASLLMGSVSFHMEGRGKEKITIANVFGVTFCASFGLILSWGLFGPYTLGQLYAKNAQPLPSVTAVLFVYFFDLLSHFIAFLFNTFATGDESKSYHDKVQFVSSLMLFLDVTVYVFVMFGPLAKVGVITSPVGCW